MAPLKPVNTAPPVNADSQQKGLLARIGNWFMSGFKTVEKDAGVVWHDFLKEATFNNVEAVGADILSIIGQLYLGHIMMQGPVGAEESESRFKQFAGSAAGQAIIMGGLNLAGSIPSLGQVDNVGQAAESIVNNLGFGLMNWQMMQPVMEQTSNNPLRSKYRETAQSNTLDEEQVTTAYSKGLVSETEMDSQLKELGYSEEFHPVVKELSRQVPDVNTLQQMYQTGSISSEDLATYLRQNGYTDQSINHIAHSITNVKPDETVTEIISILKQLTENEHLSQSQFSDMMKALGTSDDNINKAIVALQASTTVKGLQQEIQTLGDLYKQGQLSQGQLAKQLQDLGLEETNITKLIETQTQQIMNSNPLQKIITLDETLAKGLIDTQSYMKQLQDLGMTEEEAVGKLITEQDKINTNLGTELSKNNVNQTDVNVAFAEGLIDETQFTNLSIQVGTEPGLIDSLIHSLAPHKVASVKPVPMSILEGGLYNKSLTEDKVLQLLIANGFSAGTAQTILTVWNANALRLNGNQPVPTEGGVASSYGYTGRDLTQLNPTRYTAQMTTLELTSQVQISIIAMVYNSLIRGGFISDADAVKLLGEIGITPQEAELILQ